MRTLFNISLHFVAASVVQVMVQKLVSISYLAYNLAGRGLLAQQCTDCGERWLDGVTACSLYTSVNPPQRYFYCVQRMTERAVLQEKGNLPQASENYLCRFCTHIDDVAQPQPCYNDLVAFLYNILIEDSVKSMQFFILWKKRKYGLKWQI